MPLVGSGSSSSNSPSADLTDSSEHDMVDEPELGVVVVKDRNVKNDMRNAQLFIFPLSSPLLLCVEIRTIFTFLS